jgi:hypothetical protein
MDDFVFESQQNKQTLSHLRNWSEGYITVLLKSGDVVDPNNYRGLTITNAFGKLFNCILNNRLDSFLSERKIINN